jgi:hypothetical protein
MMESHPCPDLGAFRSNLADLCTELGACAVGYWRLDRETALLLLVAFVPGVGLDPEAGRAFERATQVVPLDQQSLGIVVAAVSGRPAISRVAELPADVGSGAWLRSFGASRSVAVPHFSAQGRVIGVISVALAEHVGIDDAMIAEKLHRAME